MEHSWPVMTWAWGTTFLPTAPPSLQSILVKRQETREREKPKEVLPTLTSHL